MDNLVAKSFLYDAVEKCVGMPVIVEALCEDGNHQYVEALLEKNGGTYVVKDIRRGGLVKKEVTVTFARRSIVRFTLDKSSITITVKN